MKKLILFSPVTMLTTYNSYEQKRNIGAPGELDIQSIIQRIPATVKFMKRYRLCTMQIPLK